MLASPLGRMSCNGAGFELNLNGSNMLVASATIKPVSIYIGFLQSLLNPNYKIKTS